MEEKKSKKTIGRDSLAIILAVILVLGYIVYECYSVTHIELETETAITTTIYEAIDTTALIVRDEHIIGNASSGVTVPVIADGDKINVGGTVAMSFDSAESATDYSKYSLLADELQYYEKLESQTVGQAASVESINAEIDNDLNTYIQAISTHNANSINSEGDSINDVLLRRQMIIGQKVDLASITKDIRKQMEELSSSSKSANKITTDTSGVFISYTDGYESLCDYSKVKELKVEDIEKKLDAVKKEKDTTDNLGKLITSYDWYLACVVDADAVKMLENGQSIDIAFKSNSNRVYRVKIIDGAEPDLGTEKTALILECNDMNAELGSMRAEDIEIRISEHTGIKVPTSALHVVDGKKGIYALISSQVRFREADVVYSGDDYVLLSYDTENKDGIRLYDKIILQGKDLEDGKVYT